jgi:hypothetical protein
MVPPMQTTHAERRKAVIKKGLADSTKVRDARNRAYQAAFLKQISKAEVDKRFGAEVSRRYYDKTGESLDPVSLYSEIEKSYQ